MGILNIPVTQQAMKMELGLFCLPQNDKSIKVYSAFLVNLPPPPTWWSIQVSLLALSLIPVDFIDRKMTKTKKHNIFLRYSMRSLHSVFNTFWLF